MEKLVKRFKGIITILIFVVALGASDMAFAKDDILIQPDGKIVLSEDAVSHYSNNQYMVRINSNGSLDNTFNLSSEIASLAGNFFVRLDGKIVGRGLA